MFEEFSAGLMMKKFAITDSKFIYDYKEYDYRELSKITMIVSPSIITNGVAQVTINGSVKQLAYKFADRERAARAIDYANRKIDEAHGAVKNYMYRMQAHTGTSLEVYDSYLILSFMATGSIMANIAKGGANGGKRINFSDITAIQFKEPAGMSVGFIQFTYPGSGESKSGVIAAINDENSIPVSPQNLAQAREIVDYIERRRSALRNGGNVQAVSAMDELKKLKELLDIGIVTQAEFEAKKKQLLNL